MRVLVYGVGSDILGGIETFLFNMNSYMSKDCIFDYVIEGQSTIHKNRIKSQGGKVYYIAPKRQMKKNIEDWKRLLSEKKMNLMLSILMCMHFLGFFLSNYVKKLAYQLSSMPIIIIFMIVVWQ